MIALKDNITLQNITNSASAAWYDDKYRISRYFHCTIWYYEHDNIIIYTIYGRINLIG